MADEWRQNDHPEPDRTDETPPATWPEGSRDGAVAPVTVCRPLGATDLGFHTRLLWTLQAGVWAADLRFVQNVDPALAGIRRCLLALSDRINQVQYTEFTELATRIEDRHDEAAMFKGRLMAELFEELADRDAAGRALPGRIEQRATVLRGWQHQDWDAVRAVAWKAVEGDRRLEGWWEIGFRVADLTLPAVSDGAPPARTDENLRRLHTAIDKLPEVERAWVRDALPVVPPADPLFADTLHETYREFRAMLPSYEAAATATPHPEKADGFLPSDDYRVVRWRGRDYHFNKSEAVMVKALHDDWRAGRPGLSAAKLYGIAGLTGSDRRVELVFRHHDKATKKWVKHPALADGLLAPVGPVWRLSLENPE